MKAILLFAITTLLLSCTKPVKQTPFPASSMAAKQTYGTVVVRVVCGIYSNKALVSHEFGIIPESNSYPPGWGDTNYWTDLDAVTSWKQVDSLRTVRIDTIKNVATGGYYWYDEAETMVQTYVDGMPYNSEQTWFHPNTFVLGSGNTVVLTDTIY